MIKPKGARVLVEPILNECKTPGGIYFKDSADNHPTRGKVLAVGPGMRLEDGSRHPVCVQVGQIVHFDKFAEVAVKENGKEYFLLREKDISALEES